MGDYSFPATWSQLRGYTVEYFRSSCRLEHWNDPMNNMCKGSTVLWCSHLLCLMCTMLFLILRNSEIVIVGGYVNFYVDKLSAFLLNVQTGKTRCQFEYVPAIWLFPQFTALYYLTFKYKKSSKWHNTNSSNQRVFLNVLYRIRLSRCWMIWLLPRPLSHMLVVSLSQSSCVLLVKVTTVH